MSDHKFIKGGKEINKVAGITIVANVLLSFVKVLIGFLGSSIALIADGVHSLSDTTTDFAVLIGSYLGSKQPDSSHTYGHGRMETFSAGFIALILLFVGGSMIYYPARAIARGNIYSPSWVVFIAAIISVIVKEILYRWTKAVSKRTYSPALYANAWHHRSDALSSIAVIIGFLSIKFGFKYGDQVAGVAVGLMVILVALGILGNCLREFAETSVESETIERIKNVLESNSSVRRWHRLRTRLVGREVFLDLHILVNPELDIEQAHEISEQLEQTLHDEIPRPINIVIHVEPDLPELRIEQ